MRRGDNDGRRRWITANQQCDDEPASRPNRAQACGRGDLDRPFGAPRSWKQSPKPRGRRTAIDPQSPRPPAKQSTSMRPNESLTTGSRVIGGGPARLPSRLLAGARRKVGRSGAAQSLSTLLNYTLRGGSAPRLYDRRLSFQQAPRDVVSPPQQEGGALPPPPSSSTGAGGATGVSGLHGPRPPLRYKLRADMPGGSGVFAPDGITGGSAWDDPFKTMEEKHQEERAIQEERRLQQFDALLRHWSRQSKYVATGNKKGGGSNEQDDQVEEQRLKDLEKNHSASLPPELDLSDEELKKEWERLFPESGQLSSSWEFLQDIGLVARGELPPDRSPSYNVEYPYEPGSLDTIITGITARDAEAGRLVWHVYQDPIGKKIIDWITETGATVDVVAAVDSMTKYLTEEGLFQLLTRTRGGLTEAPLDESSTQGFVSAIEESTMALWLATHGERFQLGDAVAGMLHELIHVLVRTIDRLGGADSVGDNEPLGRSFEKSYRSRHGMVELEDIESK
jgi:hypothetical protein